MTTAPEIWQAYQNDPAFAGLLSEPKPRQVMEDYILNELLPSLGDLIDQPATPVIILRTTRAYLTGLMQSDLIERMVQASLTLPMPLEYLEEMAGDLRYMCLSLLREIEDLTQDDGWYKDEGATDQDMYERMGLTPENLAAAIAGTLTVGQLLASQPSIVLVMFQ